MENMISLFSGLDIRYVYVAAGVIAFAGVLSIIKRAIKLGIISLVITGLILYGGTTLDNIQKKYNINVDGTKVSVKVNDKNYYINLKDVKLIEAKDLGNGKVSLQIESTDGITYMEIPRFVFEVLKGQAGNYNIKIKEI